MSNSHWVTEKHLIDSWLKEIESNLNTLTIELLPRTDVRVKPNIRMLHFMSFFLPQEKRRYWIRVEPDKEGSKVHSIRMIQYHNQQPSEQYQADMSDEQFNLILSLIEDNFNVPINQMTYGIVDYV